MSSIEPNQACGEVDGGKEVARGLVVAGGDGSELLELRDGAGNLLDRYTYNVAGELARTDTGNGASITYRYDADGNVTEILDSNADGSLADRMEYTYNANGQVIESATSDGLWTYGYDASGELTSAVFQSINPAIQNQTLSYVYDAAGNRVSQTVNGVTTVTPTTRLATLFPKRRTGSSRTTSTTRCRFRCPARRSHRPR